MQGLPQKEILKKIGKMYRVNKKTAKADYEKLVYTISTLSQTEKIDPVTFWKLKKKNLSVISILRLFGWIWL